MRSYKVSSRFALAGMLAAGVAWGIAPVALGAEAPELETAAEIRACTQKNFPERTSVQHVVLVARDRGGSERSLSARIYWKRKSEDAARLMMRVEEPPDLRDASYLLIENDGRDDMFMYLPALQKVRRISAGMVSGQLWGTDFSYEDMKQIQGLAMDSPAERLPDAEVAGRPAYVLALRAAPEEASAYERIVSYVDRETCVVLKAEFFERGDRLRKRLTADPASLTSENGRWVAREIKMLDVTDETATRLRIEKVVYDEKISDRTFDPGRFYLGR